MFQAVRTLQKLLPRQEISQEQALNCAQHKQSFASKESSTEFSGTCCNLLWVSWLCCRCAAFKGHMDCSAAAAFLREIHCAHGAAVCGTGAHSVTLGMHLIFSADSTGANGSAAQAALDIARSQQDVRALLQAQGNGPSAQGIPCTETTCRYQLFSDRVFMFHLTTQLRKVWCPAGQGFHLSPLDWCIAVLGRE